MGWVPQSPVPWGATVYLPYGKVVTCTTGTVVDWAHAYMQGAGQGRVALPTAGFSKQLPAPSWPSSLEAPYTPALKADHVLVAAPSH